MADDKIKMPSGMAGITRFNEEYHGKFSFSPTSVFIFIGVLAVLLLILLTNDGALGYSLLGMS